MRLGYWRAFALAAQGGLYRHLLGQGTVTGHGAAARRAASFRAAAAFVAATRTRYTDIASVKAANDILHFGSAK
ncbi:hypothetical protein C1N53_08275 [Pontibacter sp. SGAir0037]|nr:hypothetical protein C1N53_08275 [Pontibacter sp. SGAir0037]